MRDEYAFCRRLLQEVVEQAEQDRRPSEDDFAYFDALTSDEEETPSELPTQVKRDLHQLLDAIADAESIGRTSAVVDVVTPQPVVSVPVSIDEPEEENDAFWANASFDTSMLQEPDWLGPQREIQWPVASTHCLERGAFDFFDLGGRLQCDIFLEREAEGGLLRIKWKSDGVTSGGWWFAAFVSDEKQPDFDDLLGTDAQGEVVFDAELLGFDPSTQPFRYVIYPKEDT